MKREEQVKVINETLAKANILEGMSIESINYKPHPYCIDLAHVVFASDNHSGMLSEDTIVELENKKGKGMCGMYVSLDGRYVNGPRRGYYKCRLTYKEHTFNVVLFVKLKRNASNLEVFTELKKVLDLIKQYKIEGVMFVETPEKYRVTNNGKVDNEKEGN